MNEESHLEVVRRAVRDILSELPPHVTLVAAAKMRTAEELLAACEAGIHVIGHNYVQDAEAMRAVLGGRARWHFIGHLQKNKAKKAAQLFDMIETMDSFELAARLDKECALIGKVLPILIEINSGRESAKAGVMPEDAEPLALRLATLEHLRLQGLMTMGPFTENPEEARPFFRVTKETFDHLIRAAIPNVEMRFLSMGMSDTYKMAIEEGANTVRIGTKLFGARPSQNKLNIGNAG
jgi:hypothetical protein